MKKNLLTLVIFVVTIINLILTAIMLFVVVPPMQKTNNLVTDICSVLDLELETEEKAKKDKVDMKNLEFYNITDELTIGLKPGADGESHFAVMKVSISMDTKNKDYKKYGADMDAKESLLKSAIHNVVENYTYETAWGKKEEMEKKILNELHETFGSDFIYQVIISDLTIA